MGAKLLTVVRKRQEENLAHMGQKRIETLLILYFLRSMTMGDFYLFSIFQFLGFSTSSIYF